MSYDLIFIILYQSWILTHLFPFSLLAAVNMNWNGVFIWTHHSLDIILFKSRGKVLEGKGPILEKVAYMIGVVKVLIFLTCSIQDPWPANVYPACRMWRCLVKLASMFFIHCCRVFTCKGQCAWIDGKKALILENVPGGVSGPPWQDAPWRTGSAAHLHTMDRWHLDKIEHLDFKWEFCKTV